MQSGFLVSVGGFNLFILESVSMRNTSFVGIGLLIFALYQQKGGKADNASLKPSLEMLFCWYKKNVFNLIPTVIPTLYQRLHAIALHCIRQQKRLEPFRFKPFVTALECSSLQFGGERGIRTLETL